MTGRVPSYTVAELVKETGFDRRTIAYYVQEELLPRVGRRGPRTRYPKLVRDRLLFIRRVREAEEGGRIGAVSLSELRAIFARLAPSLIARVADGRLAVTQELLSPPSTAFRLPAMRRVALRERVERLGMVREESRGYAGGLAAPEAETGLTELLSRLQETAERGADSSRSMETWTTIDVSPEIALSVRNLSEEDRELVHRVRQALRQAIRAHRSSSSRSTRTE